MVECLEGGTPMARSVKESDERDSSMKITGEELVTRLFSLVMLGVCAAILLMIIMRD